jgi:signal peptide peptidase SppA
MTKLLDIVNSPWAIDPAKLEEIQGIYLTHLRGEKIDIAALEARMGRPLQNEAKAYEVIDGVAILPLEGVVAKRMNLFSQISGGMSSELATRDLRQALDDPAVHSIIQWVDSPGGTVDGTQGYAYEAYAARGRKPIVSLASGCMASAAYWFGAAAEKVYIADLTTIVGQIGIVAKHVDTSGAEAKAGIKTTEIAAGKYKRVASSYEPLSPEGRQSIQDQVDYTYSIFVADVARFRGVSEEQVLEDMAEGRVFIGQQAIDAGLVDGVSTLDALIEQLNRDRAGAAPRPHTSPTTTTSMKGSSMNLEKLKAEHPELFKAVHDEAFAAGSTAERCRIQAVEAALIPGHEALIAGLKFDGKTSGGDAALAVNKAERDIRVAQAAANTAAAPKPVATVPAPTVTQPAAAVNEAEAARVASLPIDERCKAQWEANTGGVRGEFTSLAEMTAYAKAVESGKVKQIGRKAA